MIKNGILVLILFSVAVIGVTPNAAHAIPVIDVGAIAQITLDVIYNYAMLLLEQFWKNVFLVLLEEFKLKVLGIFMDQAVKWVTEGENGTPKFIQNWEGYLAGSFNTGFYSVGGELRNANVCGQFKDALINSAWKDVNLPFDPNSLFKNKIDCTLNPLLTALGTSQQAYQNDFRNGSWLAYGEQLFKPQNTYYGALFTANDEANMRGQSKQNASEKQAVASKGYTPIKKCIDPAGAAPEDCKQFTVTSPASVFESIINASLKGRFDYIVNIQQFWALLVIVGESFMNKLIGAGVEGLFGYGGGGQPSAGYISGCADVPGGCPAPPSQGFLPIGSACTKNTDCASAICSALGKCIEPLPNGGACNKDYQCQSLLCAPGGICKNPLSNGSECVRDYDCASSFCSPTTRTCAVAPAAPPGGVGRGGEGQSCRLDGSCDAPLACDPFTFTCGIGA